MLRGMLKSQSKKQSTFRSQGGFTLVELAIVLAVLIFLSAIFASKIVNTVNKKKQSAAVATTFENLQSALQMFRSDVGVFPPKPEDLWDKDAVTTDATNGNLPATAPNTWQGPYCSASPVQNADGNYEITSPSVTFSFYILDNTTTPNSGQVASNNANGKDYVIKAVGVPGDVASVLIRQYGTKIAVVKESDGSVVWDNTTGLANVPSLGPSDLCDIYYTYYETW